jgi:hypothetical protein
MEVCFTGGGKRSTRRKPLTLSQVTDNVVSSTPRHEGESNNEYGQKIHEQL